MGRGGKSFSDLHKLILVPSVLGVTKYTGHILILDIKKDQSINHRKPNQGERYVIKYPNSNLKDNDNNNLLINLMIILLKLILK
jgi:TRAP-type mannitol/chloroaromatic compound transport system permease large subunit